MKRNRNKGGRRRARRRGHYALTGFCVALVVVMLGLCAYIADYYVTLRRIRTEGERYAGMYPGRNAPAVTASVPTASPSPTPTHSSKPTAAPTGTPMPTDTPAPSDTPTPSPVPSASDAVTAVPTAAATPTAGPTATPEPSATPAAEATSTADPTSTPEITATPAPTPTDAPSRPGEDMPVVVDVPIPTPDADTLVVALPTPPPVQSSFDALLAANPDTVGFLEIENMLSLPVVQRPNDNEYYLNHTFERAQGREGALFMDGLNRLVPEDNCLIVYGHNMKNKTMFGKLSAYNSVDYMRQYPVVRFDTLYENRSYVVFAAFSASMQSSNSGYFDVRNVVFSEEEFDKFVLKLQSRSRYTVPIDVRYGDRLLLLVTCDYANREGRFILALRQLRDDETEASAWAAAMQAKKKGE